jgi:hypothetical protein
MFAEVMNGRVTEGDQIAYVGTKNYSGTGMRIGRVLDVFRRESGRLALKIRVEQTSGTAWGGLPYTKTIEGHTLRSVVKLGD